jgi:uncharacterized protein YsxB (DUF464 family)
MKLALHIALAGVGAIVCAVVSVIGMTALAKIAQLGFGHALAVLHLTMAIGFYIGLRVALKHKKETP